MTSRPPTVRGIRIRQDQDLLAWKVSAMRFRAKFPDLYRRHKRRLLSMEADELQMILPDQANLGDIVQRRKAVDLRLSDGTTQVIWNSDILRWYGSTLSDGFSVWSHGGMVFVAVSRCAFQAGTLAIWSVVERNWVFHHSDELFCVEAVVPDKARRRFIGMTRWFLPTVCSGIGFFEIASGFKFRSIGARKLSKREADNALVGRRHPLNTDPDSWIAVDRHRPSIVVVAEGREAQPVAYRLSP